MSRARRADTTLDPYCAPARACPASTGSHATARLRFQKGTNAMSITSKAWAAAATVTIVGAAIAPNALPVSAATPACGSQCGSVFSRELGTYAQPNVVEDIASGQATV